MEIDRELEINAEVLPQARYAFPPPPSRKRGEVIYRAVDVFCLAIALDLLDAVYKQTEIVFLMRYLRTDLEALFSELLVAPSLTDRQRYRAKDYPDQPYFEDTEGKKWADRRVFVILQKLEITEISIKLSNRQHAEPIFLEPIFCDGITDLGAKLFLAQAVQWMTERRIMLNDGKTVIFER